MTHASHGTVSREIDGKFYSGIWTVEGYDRGDLLTVAGQGVLAGLTENAQLGGSPPEALAGQMLREIVKKYKAAQDARAIEKDDDHE